MPTRNINLTDHFDKFIESSVESGRFSNASELVREGLRLLEQHEQENAEEAIAGEEVAEQPAQGEAAEHRHPAAQARRLGLSLLSRRSLLPGLLVRGGLLLRRLGRCGGRGIVRNASLHSATAGATEAPGFGIFHDERADHHGGAKAD